MTVLKASVRSAARWRGWLLAALIPVLILAAPAWGADASHQPGAYRVKSFRLPPVSIPYEPPVPTRRAAAVWASEPCWQDCTAQCGAQFQVCLRVDWIDDCVTQSSACNLRCQKACRLYGGPLLPWTD
jgi:hypothetical protein